MRLMLHNIIVKAQRCSGAIVYELSVWALQYVDKGLDSGEACHWPIVVGYLPSRKTTPQRPSGWAQKLLGRFERRRRFVRVGAMRLTMREQLDIASRATDHSNCSVTKRALPASQNCHLGYPTGPCSNCFLCIVSPHRIITGLKFTEMRGLPWTGVRLFTEPAIEAQLLLSVMMARSLHCEATNSIVSMF